MSLSSGSIRIHRIRNIFPHGHILPDWIHYIEWGQAPPPVSLAGWFHVRQTLIGCVCVARPHLLSWWLNSLHFQLALVLLRACLSLVSLSRLIQPMRPSGLFIRRVRLFSSVLLARAPVHTPRVCFVLIPLLLGLQLSLQCSSHPLLRN